MKIVISTILLILCLSSYCQNNEDDDYLIYIDSAYTIYEDKPKLAIAYLDSIPEPIEQTLKGHLANYFKLKGFISDRVNNRAETFHNFLLALKYAKVENNYNIAGMASVELFYNAYFIKNDTATFHYLDDAETYFKKVNNTSGIAEVQQMYAYVELYNENYAKSNALILDHLTEYKNIKDDGYYYMHALLMLSTNYIHLEDLNNSHKYFNRLKGLKKDSTISKYLYDFHKVSITEYIAEYHLSKQAMDSTLYYLKATEKLKHAMSNIDKELYFKLYADYYAYFEDLESKERYIDSLTNFQTSLLEKNMEASIKINESLEKSDNLLESETNKKHFNRNLIILLLSILGIFSVIFIMLTKKSKAKISGYINKENKSSQLKTSHEKLKVKLVGLEKYILKLKDEVKTISTLNDPVELRKSIKVLYKNIHLKSSTELANGESHLELINDLNIDFFTKIKDIYPELKESEIIICYYIFTGFKNKEIASFLNASVRSVESKRYRISKKLDIVSGQTTLTEHLQSIFSVS